MADKRVDIVLTAKDKASPVVEKFGKNVDGALGDAEKSSKSFTESLGDIKNGVVAAAGAFIGLDLVTSAFESAEAYRLLAKRIELATGNQKASNEIMKQLVDISISTHAPLEQTGDLFVRMSNATKETGVSQSQLLRFTEGINNALLVSGKTAEQAAGGLEQLAQGLGAGALRGDEFNSVAETMPVLLTAVAKELGTTRGQLRSLAAEGKITGEVLLNAVIGMGDTWREQAAQMPVGLRRALGDIQTAWQAYLGQSEEIEAANNALGAGLSLVADNLDAIAGVAANAALAAIPATFAQMTRASAKWATQSLETVKANRAQAQSAKEQALAQIEAAKSQAVSAKASQAVAAERVKLAVSEKQAAANALATAAAFEVEAKATLQAAKDAGIYGDHRAAAEREVTAATQKRKAAELELAAASRSVHNANIQATASSKAYAAAQYGIDAAQANAAKGASKLRASLKLLADPMNILSAGMTAVMAHDIGGWLREQAVQYEQSAEAGNVFAEALRMIGLGATEAEAAEIRLAETNEKIRSKLEEVSKQTGVNVRSMDELNEAVKKGALDFNEATGSWEKGAVSLDKVTTSATRTAAQYKTVIEAMESGDAAIEKSAQSAQKAAEGHAEFVRALGQEKDALDAEVEAAEVAAEGSKLRLEAKTAQLALSEKNFEALQKEAEASDKVSQQMKDDLVAAQELITTKREEVKAAEQVVAASEREVTIRRIAQETYGDQSDAIDSLGDAYVQAAAKVQSLDDAQEAAARATDDLVGVRARLQAAEDELSIATQFHREKVGELTLEVNRLQAEEERLIEVSQRGEQAEGERTRSMEELSAAGARYKDALSDIISKAPNLAGVSEAIRAIATANKAGILTTEELAAAKEEVVARAEQLIAQFKAEGKSVELLEATVAALNAELDKIPSEKKVKITVDKEGREDVDKVKKSIKETGEATKEAASEAQQFQQHLQATGETFEGFGAGLAFLKFMQDYIGAARAEMEKLSDGAAEMFDNLMQAYTASKSGKFIPEGSGDEIKDLQLQIRDIQHEIQFAVSDLSEWFKTVQLNAARTRLAFAEQEKSAQAMIDRLADMDTANSNVVRSAESMINSYELLDDQTLGQLEAEVQRVIRANEQMAASAERALQRYQDLIDRQSGNELAIAERRRLNELKKLEEELQAARKAGNHEIARDLEQALTLARKYHDEEIRLLKVKLDGEKAVNKERERGRELDKLPPGAGVIGPNQRPPQRGPSRVPVTLPGGQTPPTGRPLERLPAYIEPSPRLKDEIAAGVVNALKNIDVARRQSDSAGATGQPTQSLNLTTPTGAARLAGSPQALADIIMHLKNAGAVST